MAVTNPGGKSLPAPSPQRLVYDPGSPGNLSGCTAEFSHVSQEGVFEVFWDDGVSFWDAALRGRQVSLITATGGRVIAINGSGPIQLGAPFQTAAANEAATATAGGGAALPATVAGFLIFQDHLGTTRKLPYYAV